MKKLLLLSVLILFFNSVFAQKTIRKPNVIFILADDHRHDFMSFLPNNVPWLKTPHLDRMAREGTHCQNAFVTTALCSPSRASILTGLYTHSHTVVDNMAPEPKGLTYFPQYLQQAGYQTAFFGKWHMGDEGDHPRPGFHQWVSFKGQGVYYNPTLNVNGKQVAHKDSAYISDVLTDYTLDWLTKRDKAKPFFVYLSHKAVHAEFRPNRQDRGMYGREKINYPQSFGMTKPDVLRNSENPAKGIPEWVKNQRYSWHGVDYLYNGATTFEDFVHDYCETLHSMDASIGRVLAYLDKNGLTEHTMVIYMGDNGFSFGEHGLIDKRHAYEESMRVPLLVRYPAMTKAQSKLPQMIQNVDIGPTILELAGVPKPKQMQGRSFLPLLQGKSVTDWRQKIFYEYYWEYDFPQTPTMHAVRTDRYKLIRYHGVWDTNEFYDLQTDPAEMNNLIASPEHQPLIKQLTSEIYDWLEGSNGMQIPLKRTIKYRNSDHKHQNTY
ncbi:MAG: sulfatase [Cytophagales bacterium]|nr:sulfatase [Cytophagales bacterium]